VLRGGAQEALLIHVHRGGYCHLYVISQELGWRTSRAGLMRLRRVIETLDASPRKPKNTYVSGRRSIPAGINLINRR
jgi:hypothetical protein